MKDLGAPIATNLDNYGPTEEDVKNLDKAITSFIAVISDPSLATDERKEDNVQVLIVADKIRTLFNTKLDKLMRSFEVDYPVLHKLCEDARAIDVNGSAKAPTVEKEVAPNSTATVHTIANYNDATFYTFQNQGKEPVSISLSGTDNEAGPEPVLLLPGETRSRLAENLAPAGTYLVATNDSVSAVKLRVWVEA